MRSSFKSSAVPERSVVCDGNSLTAGAGGTPYPIRLSELLRIVTVTNLGVSGKRTQQLIDDFNGKVRPYSRQGAELVFFEQYNSFSPTQGNNSVETEKALAQQYVAQAQTGGFEVWICTPPPTSDTDINDKITLYSVWLRANHGFANGFIDLNAIPELTPPGNIANPTYFSESAHLTTVGYAALATKVYAAIL
jgi:hypothetical protein